MARADALRSGGSAAGNYERMYRKRSTHLLLLVIVLLSGCAVLVNNYERLYGPSAPKERTVSAQQIAAAGYVSFHEEVQPILEQRCVVCHSCYDAPCQLNLTSYEGIGQS